MNPVRLFSLEGATPRDPGVEAWFAQPPRELRSEGAEVVRGDALVRSGSGDAAGAVALMDAHLRDLEQHLALQDSSEANSLARLLGLG